ncbi:acyltransferase [Solihabitans fulvus]|uniref:Acyltransferase n=1 Tax=Solihabitans fulvus TaxID=1892852 RepID=A0A5B2XIL6_9PSEU|nr:acyltransferase [Solihabitans fulvus]KAA2262839.1 acyltransferase [Solihabitans fulvus]
MRLRTGVRDPFIDLIRVVATALVVLQHCLMPVFSVRGNELQAGNALATPGWWVITWLSQVMPLVFIAGGAANSLSYRSHVERGGEPAHWLAKRVRRLAIPVLPLAAVWIPLPHLLLALGVPEQPVHLAAAVVPQLLWFLVVYLAAVLCTPLAVAAHRRFGLAVLPALALVAVGVDVLRFNWIEQAGYLNAVVVWLAVHQLGLCYADGLFERLTRRGAALLSVAGFGSTALLVAFGPYPTSMIGMPGAPLSNMNPPTICLLGLACGQLGLALLARRTLLRWAARPRVTAVLRAMAPRMMTVYLWHMSALAVITGITVIGLGYRTPNPDGLAWWLIAPLWLAAVLVVLIGLVRLFARFEAEQPAQAGTPGGLGRVLAGAVLVAAGLLGFTVGGFGPAASAGLFAGPLPWVVALLAGLLLTAPVRVAKAAGSKTVEPKTVEPKTVAARPTAAPEPVPAPRERALARN